MFGSFPPNPLIGLRLQSLLGPGSRHCYGIITLKTPIFEVNECNRLISETDFQLLASLTIVISARANIGLPLEAVQRNTAPVAWSGGTTVSRAGPSHSQTDACKKMLLLRNCFARYACLLRSHCMSGSRFLHWELCSFCFLW